MGESPREAEPHGQDGDPLGVVEDLGINAEPAPQPVTRGVGEGPARGMDPDPRRLARDQDARLAVQLEDRPGLVQQPLRAGHIAANSTPADFLKQLIHIRYFRSLKV